LVVRFTVRAGSEAVFDDLTRRTLVRIREEEPGTLIYTCHEVEGRPQQRIFYELYRDRAAFEVHESQEHVRRFLAERESLLEATEVDFLAPVLGKLATNAGNQ
jgi:quinol monooxygenase YgiN